VQACTEEKQDCGSDELACSMALAERVRVSAISLPTQEIHPGSQRKLAKTSIYCGHEKGSVLIVLGINTNNRRNGAESLKSKTTS
jgi:hypothetical protein